MKKLYIIALLVINTTNFVIAMNFDNKKLSLGQQLIDATENGDLKTMKFLIENGARIDVKDSQGGFPLHRAAWNNNIDAMRLLIGNGANINVQDESGDTPLHIAVVDSDMNVIKLLIENNVNVNIQNNKSETPLHYAANKGDMTIMRYLIKYGAKFDIRGELGKSPSLLFDNGINNIEAIKLFIENGVNINIETIAGYTPLHYAASGGDTETMTLFIKNGAKVNVKDRYGNTPLYYAVINNNVEMVKILMTSPIMLNNNSNISHEMIKTIAFQSYLVSDTDLSKKFRGLHLEILKKYIAMKGESGKTALELAQDSKKNAIVVYLNTFNNSKEYSDLDEDIKIQIEASYKNQLAPSDYWVNKERALCMPLMNLA